MILVWSYQPDVGPISVLTQDKYYSISLRCCFTKLSSIEDWVSYVFEYNVKCFIFLWTWQFKLIYAQNPIHSTMCFAVKVAIVLNCLLDTQKIGIWRPKLHRHLPVGFPALPHKWHCKNFHLIRLQEKVTGWATEIGSWCAE